MNESQTSRPMSRRVFATAGFAIAAVAGTGWSVWPNASYEGGELSVEEAYETASAGEIILVDIRRPDEWARTGIGDGAHPIDMRRDDFVASLDTLTGADKSVPVALICARGVRSARLSNALSEAGYTKIINVPEGMLGSRAGPGWIETGLPVRAQKR